MARLNADGTFDSTFDGDGFLRYTFGSGGELGTANGVAVAADGKILVAGTTAGAILVSGHTETRPTSAAVVG